MSMFRARPRLTLALVLLLGACSSKAADSPATDSVPTVAPSAAAAARNAVVDTIRDLEQKWADAIRGRDSVALNRLMSTEFILTGTDTTQPPVPRATWMNNTLTKLKVDSIRITPAEVNVRGDTADAEMNFFWMGKFGALPAFRDSTMLTDRWIRGPAGWQVHRRMMAD